MDSTTCAQFTLIALPTLYLPGIPLSQQAILQSPKQLCASPLRDWALSYASPSMRLRKMHSPSCMDKLFKEDLEKITQISDFFSCHDQIPATVTQDGEATSWENTAFPKHLESSQTEIDFAWAKPTPCEPHYQSFLWFGILGTQFEDFQRDRKIIVYFLLSENRIRANVPFRSHTSYILIYMCFVWFLTRFEFHWPNY